MTSSHQFEVVIPSDTSEGQAVQERIISLLEEFSYSDRDVFGVRLALEEAIVNAIKHGNRMSAEKSVTISCKVDEEMASVVIEDEGDGFDMSDVPDPTEEENWDRPCGRGILLMRSFLTKVEYNDKGNKVLLEKLRVSPEEDSDD